jgi:hypothetical protein
MCSTKASKETEKEEDLGHSPRETTKKSPKVTVAATVQKVRGSGKEVSKKEEAAR